MIIHMIKNIKQIKKSIYRISQTSPLKLKLWAVKLRCFNGALQEQMNSLNSNRIFIWLP